MPLVGVAVVLLVGVAVSEVGVATGTVDAAVEVVLVGTAEPVDVLAGPDEPVGEAVVVVGASRAELGPDISAGDEDETETAAGGGGELDAAPPSVSGALVVEPTGSESTSPPPPGEGALGPATGGPTASGPTAGGEAEDGGPLPPSSDPLPRAGAIAGVLLGVSGSPGSSGSSWRTVGGRVSLALISEPLWVG